MQSIEDAESSGKRYFVRTSSNWGDAGSILIGGFVIRHPQPKRVEIQRTGPYVPAISETQGVLILSQQDRDDFLSRWGEQLRQIPSSLTKVVKSPWTGEFQVDCDWDWHEEPDDIIMGGDHSEEVAAAMDMLSAYEPIVSARITGYTVDYKRKPYVVRYRGSPLIGEIGLAILPGGYSVYCDETFKEWVNCRANYNKWLEFRPLEAE